MKRLHFAPDAWRCLNGIFCIYKPSGVFSIQVCDTLKKNLCRDLNEMEKRPPRPFVEVKGSISSPTPFSVEVRENFADNELVSGAHYQTQDIRIKAINPPGKYTSGVELFGINDGCYQAAKMGFGNFLRKYEVKGKLGLASHNFMADGRVKERSTYHHVKQEQLDRLLGSIQSSHQSLAFKYSGVDIYSQEAYELASKGVVRPGTKTSPIIYSIKCIDFNPPNFTLEIHSVNENETFFAELIHQIGVYLKSCAVCTQLRRTQFSHFTVDHALLRKHWTLEDILNNISLCRNLMSDNAHQPQSAHFEVINSAKLKQVMSDMQKNARDDVL